MASPVSSFAYPSTPSPSSTSTGSLPSHLASVSVSSSTMGGNNTANVDGVGVLTYQRAIDIARNTEGELDPNVATYLEDAVRDIWSNIQTYPESYVLTKDEFAVFNYFRQQFEGDLAEQAVDRYWRSTHANEARS